MSAEPPEIIFVRRSLHRRAEVPHTGVWKIAYADFMTAMMAFFLVMWLINATDQKTREAVASYFNPIKLAEATVDKKGLRDPLETEKDGKPDGKDQRSAVESTDENLKGYSETLDKPNQRKPRYSEAALFEDPYAVLAALVAGSEPNQSADNVGAFETLGQSGEPGLNGGDAQRDPFDPVYWKMSRKPTPQTSDQTVSADEDLSEPPPAQATAVNAEAKSDTTAPATNSSPGETTEKSVTPVPTEGAVASETNQTASAQTQTLPGGNPEKSAAVLAASSGNTGAEKQVEGQPSTGVEAVTPKDGLEAKALGRDIQAAVGNIGPTPGIEVTAAPEGLLVTLMDERKFGMFAVGSAEPEPELIRTIDAIGKLIGDRPGKIVVRGHTDARPFRNKDYDNWRLSTARAHMAYYMLVRGGVPEARFEKIEGYADHWLKNAGDPEAPENRRIEILIRETPT